MSEFRDIQAAIVTDREPGTVERCVNETTGRVFFAEVSEAPIMEIVDSIGPDAREQAVIYISDRTASAEITPKTSIRIYLFGVAHKFRPVRFEDNPSSPQVEIGLQRIVPGKDQA